MKTTNIRTLVLRFVLTLAVLLTAPISGNSQEADSSITIGTRMVFYSEVLDKDMHLSVHLPDSYHSTDRRYPLLCTFQTHFEQVAGTVKNLYDYRLTPEIIVIRIDNYEYGYLTPVTLKNDSNTGKADDFLRFFKDELFPHFDQTYRTQPYRIVFSNSWGGMFCAYAVLAKPDVFNAGIASVPWVIFDGEERFMINNARNFLDAGQYGDHFLYLAADNETELFPDLQVFVDILKNNPREGLRWEYYHWPEEDHYSTGHRALHWGLRVMYTPWSSIPDKTAAGGLETVKAYESSLTDQYGYEIGISPSAIRAAAQMLKNANDYDKAIELYNHAVTIQPDDALVWVSLGRAYQESGQIDLARQAFETAYRIAVEQSHSQVNWIKNFLDKLSDSSAVE